MSDQNQAEKQDAVSNSEFIEALGLTGKYRIDDSFVEHGCCWGSAVVRDCKEGAGMYGNGVYLVCECDKYMAETICNALNATIQP